MWFSSSSTRVDSTLLEMSGEPYSDSIVNRFVRPPFRRSSLAQTWTLFGVSETYQSFYGLEMYNS